MTQQIRLPYDVARCHGGDCKLKENCKRFLANADGLRVVVMMDLLCRLGIHRAAIVHHLNGETCYDCVRCGWKVKSKGYHETLNEAPEVGFPVQFAKQVAVLLKEGKCK